MPHRHTFRNFTHRVWAIWDLCHHDLFRIIPNPGSLQRVTLFFKSICTVPFQPRASDDKMSKLRHQSTNRRISCFVKVFPNIRWTWVQANENPGSLVAYPARYLFGCYQCWVPAASHANRPTNRSSESCWMQQWLAESLLQQEVDRVYPPSITCVHLAVDLTILWVSKGYQFTIEVCLERKMC